MDGPQYTDIIERMVAASDFGSIWKKPRRKARAQAQHRVQYDPIASPSPERDLVVGLLALTSSPAEPCLTEKKGARDLIVLEINSDYGSHETQRSCAVIRVGQDIVI